MKNLSLNFNSSHPAIVVLFAFILAILLIAGVILVVNNSSNNNTLSNASIVEDESLISSNIDTSDWIKAPYYSDMLNFIAYYPSDWQLSYIGTPNDMYEGQYLLSVNTISDEYFNPVNNMTVTFNYDSGDDLKTWVNKKVEVLSVQKGYVPIIDDLIKDGVNFQQVCFLGSPDHSPMQSCYIFMRKDPYIIEFNAIGSSSDFKAKNYLDAFYSKIVLLDYFDHDMSFYESFNGGFNIMYPEDKYPVVENISEYGVTFTKDYIGSFVSIEPTPTYLDGNTIETIWYSSISNFSGSSVKVPQEVYLDGKRCIYNNLNRSDYGYGGFIEPEEFYCQLDDNVFVIRMSAGGSGEIDNLIYYMLTTLEFTDSNVIDDNNLKYKSKVGKFEIDYPSDYRLGFMGDGPGSYISFYELNPPDGIGYSQGVSISFQASEYSLDECFEKEDCLWFANSNEEYSNLLFKGISARESIYEDVFENLKGTTRWIIFKNNGVLFSININTLDDYKNEKIDKIINSFTFL